MLDFPEPINVWVLFKKNNIEPHSFSWKNRSIKVTKVNLVHTSSLGASVFYHFSVSSGSNFYRLRFDTKTLKWHLEAVEEDL